VIRAKRGIRKRRKEEERKDGKINKKGEKLTSFLEKREILNGCTEENEEGEYTFIGGKQVIDYVLGDEEVRGKAGRLRIGEKMDSDHHPIEV